MAMHVAGDAYAHKAIVPNSAEVINYIKDKNNKENFYTQHTMTYTIPETLGLSVKTNCITMSGLSAYTIQGRDTQVHKVCADNPGFCPRRYQYGAQNVVETLLFQFSKKLTSFGITSFYNYGANKNNIFQYRLDKYAIQANGNKNPGNLNWSAYSGNKTK